MTLRVGTVTIGQAPRLDITPDLTRILGSEVELVEAGALDGLPLEQIKAMGPHEGDYVLVTRLADGTSVQICERTVTPLVRQKIAAHFATGIPAVLLLCTGEFPEFPSEGLLLRPQRVLFNVVKAVAEGAKLGVFMPSHDQLEQSHRRVALRETRGKRPRGGGTVRPMGRRRAGHGLHGVQPGDEGTGPPDHGQARHPGPLHSRPGAWGIGLIICG